MKKIGISCRSLVHSQLSFYLVKNLNDYIRECGDLNCTIFYEDQRPYMGAPLCPIMHVIEVNGFEFPVIATSLGTANKLINSYGPTRKIFYPYSLEWIGPQPFQYEYVSKILCSPELELIARNKDHADLLKNNFNRDVIGTVEDFNIQELFQCLNLK